MTKEAVNEFISSLENVGLTNFSIRYEGGNRSAINNKYTKIVIRDNDVVIISKSKDYTDDAQFNVEIVPFDNIDNMKVIDLNFKNTIDVLTELGIYNDETKEYISSMPLRSSAMVVPNAGLDVIKNSEGEVIIPSGISGYLTNK